MRQSVYLLWGAADTVATDTIIDDERHEAVESGSSRLLQLCCFLTALLLFFIVPARADRVLDLSLAERLSGRTISLAGDDLKIADIFLFISINTGVDILVDTSITETVSFDFKDNSLNSVFGALLDIADARYVDRSGVAFVFKKQRGRDGLPQRFSTRLCPQYQAAAEIYNSMRALYGYGEDLVLEEGRGCLLISGTPQHVLKARDVFKELDRPAALFCIDARLIKVSLKKFDDLPIEWGVGEEPDAGPLLAQPSEGEPAGAAPEAEQQFLVGEMAIDPETVAMLEDDPAHELQLLANRKAVIAVDQSTVLRLDAADFDKQPPELSYELEVTPGLQQFRDGYIEIGLSQHTTAAPTTGGPTDRMSNFSLNISDANSLVLVPAPLPEKQPDSFGDHWYAARVDESEPVDGLAAGISAPFEVPESYVTLILVTPRVIYNNESCAVAYRKLNGSCEAEEQPVPGMASSLPSATRRIIAVTPLRERERYQL